MGILSFEVSGEPAPKGSMRAVLRRDGTPVLVPSGSSANARALYAWHKAIREQASRAIGEHRPLFVDVALEVYMLFKLARPASHYSKGRDPGRLLPSAPPDHWHIVKPDGDKLARSTLDALTGVLYDDDARIAIQHPIKQWVPPGREGVVITVRPLPRLLQQAELAIGGTSP